MKAIAELQAQLKAARAEHHALHEGDPRRSELEASHAKCKDLANKFAAALVGDAKPCPNCGGAPTGLVLQQRLDDVADLLREHAASAPAEIADIISGNTIDVVELGCVNCRHHRARGLSAEAARANWNRGVESYEGIVTDEDGSVLGVPGGWVPRVHDDAAVNKLALKAGR